MDLRRVFQGGICCVELLFADLRVWLRIAGLVGYIFQVCANDAGFTLKSKLVVR